MWGIHGTIDALTYWHPVSSASATLLERGDTKVAHKGQGGGGGLLTKALHEERDRRPLHVARKCCACHYGSRSSRPAFWRDVGARGAIYGSKRWAWRVPIVAKTIVVRRARDDPAIKKGGNGRSWPCKMYVRFNALIGVHWAKP